MNFQEVLNANGEKRVVIGTLKEIKGEGLTQNQKPFKKVSVIDNTGATKNVKIYGENLPGPAQIGQTLTFSISTYDYTYEGQLGKAFSGFWNSTSPAPPQPQQQSYQQPQAPQARPQATTDKDRLIVTQVVYKALHEGSTFSEALLKEGVDMIFRVAENKPAQQAPLQTQPLPQDTTDYFPNDDSIPF